MVVMLGKGYDMVSRQHRRLQHLLGDGGNDRAEHRGTRAHAPQVHWAAKGATGRLAGLAGSAWVSLGEGGGTD